MSNVSRVLHLTTKASIGTPTINISLIARTSGYCVARMSTSSAAIGDRNEALKLRLKEDMKASMKTKEKIKLAVVKSLLSEISYAEKEPAHVVFDVSTILQRSLKRRQDALEQYKAAKASELAATELAEIEIINSYLPKQMSSEEIMAVLKDTIQQVGATSEKDLGKVMKAVKLDAAVAPKKLVSDLVKSMLKTGSA